MATQYLAVAQQILTAVGGQENIEHANHCATRLRLNLKDDSQVDEKSLYELSEVVKLVNNGSQFQIVIGPKVEKIFAALSELMPGAQGVRPDT
ncbi:PTS transporter subunit EIIB [Kluyvera sp. EC_51]|uniref:PTS transporter subunit EIIB n=1 Tax=Kluyvera sp. EC_51 TaxID=2584089 RepID=UPI001C707535|nr:PTS glucose/sucrose transporter subunit IIB [Kluyvera sp. EC_51]MBW9463978.1 PTS transporter subunit EIIB [Kluyvera sp. EC_51]